MSPKKNDNLIDLILSGKNEKLEFSDENLAEPAIAKHIVAFSNSKGGLLLFGIDDDSAVVGIRLPDLESRLRELVANLIYPAIFPSYEEVTITGKKIGVLRVPEGSQKPHYFQWKNKQHYMIRLDKTTRQATPEELRSMMEKSGTIRYELTPLSHAAMDDLDFECITWFCQTHCNLDLSTLNDADQTELLQKMDVLTKCGDAVVPTVAGLLLFGTDPVSSLASSGITIVVYDGDYGESDASLKISCSSAYVGMGAASADGRQSKSLIDEAMIAIEQNVPQISGKSVFSLETVREAITNAILHRDYSITNMQISVRIFNDRIEVLSPGLFSQTSPHIGNAKFSAQNHQNSTLYTYLGEAGAFDPAVPGLFEQNLPASEKFTEMQPRIEELDNQIKVTLFAKC